MQSRDYTFWGTTQSLCPDCREVVPAKIIVRGKRVYFRKRCPTHGEREDFVCSDIDYYDRLDHALPARVPARFGVEPDAGCPRDCGLCTEHEQHTCIGIVELTSSCNLTCPMCYATSAPGGVHFSVEQCQRAIDRLVEVEGRPEILQLSGGEPTVHPQFEQIFDYAIAQPIDYVMLNTNGIRLARDPQLVERLARHRERVEVYFQMDGLRDDIHQKLRGEALLDTKLRALDALAAADVHVTLVVTLQAGINDDQPGPLIEFAAQRPHITGVSFQPATYTGRHVLPEELERRITFPDVIKAVARQTNGMFETTDFLPLPCAHPNCHSLAIAYRDAGQLVPVTRFIDARANLDLLANGISFTRPQARQIIQQYLARQGCCPGGGCAPPSATSAGLGEPNLIALDEIGAAQALNPQHAAAVTDNPSSLEFFAQVLEEQLGAKNILRITITSFLDAYNFDVRRVMKCCTHHVLPSGQVVPFCAYNTLYRDGHLPLPKVTR